jgi:hypothetical protein
VRRVILYIDDLDRCPSDVVIKVLEAVHLLVALPLFVVVVAVDAAGFGRLVRGVSGPLAATTGTPTNTAGPDIVEHDQPEPTARRASTATGRAAGNELRPRQLEISEEELTYLPGLVSLVGTPRAAKRLINLYRLVRARLWDTEVDDFVTRGPGRQVVPLVRRFSFGDANGPRPETGGRSSVH